MTPALTNALAALASRLTASGDYEGVDVIDTASARIARLEEALRETRAKALEEAAVISETWFEHHRPQQPKKSRFDIYDIEHWAKSATRLVAEDIRARAALGSDAG